MVVHHIGILVFAHHQMAIACHGEIIAIIELVGRGGFVKQRNPVRSAALARTQAENLPQLGSAAIGAAEIQLPIAHVNPLAAGKDCRACRCAAGAQIILGGFHIIKVDPAGCVHCACLHGCAVPVAGVSRAAIHRQCLQLSAQRQLASHRGNEAIEQAVAAVFCQIDNAGARIDCGGFMVEPAHGLERHGIHQPAGIGGHFKHPAMRLGIARAGRDHGFLAGQPAAPGGCSASTIANGARQRAILLFHRQRCSIQHNRRGAARHHHFAVDPVEP